MYETFFQLQQRPFAAAARVDRYFPATAIEAARQTLARCIERAEGAGMLVGPPGSGKTLLCLLLAEQFRGGFEIALLSNGHLGTRRELLQAILFELGLPFRRMDEGELRLTLVDHLADDRSGRKGLLLILDEAHTFPVRLLEEVRLITNLVHDGQPRVRLMLAGAPILEERFASPRLAAFSQRIASRCYLESWNASETRQFVVNQLATVGGDAQRTFSGDALDAIFRATDGIPRLVNQLCDHALILAFAGGRGHLDASGIEEAWADLQQLPTPWNDGPSALEAARPVADDLIEFGGLDDDELAGGMNLESPEDAPQRHAVLLREIEDHLTSLEDDFEPVGTIGLLTPSRPPRPANPLDERFAEEEVLVDRYASFEMSRIGRYGSVESHEGRVLSALLQPHLPLPAAPRLSLVESPLANEVEPAVGPFAACSIEACAAPALLEVGWTTAASQWRPNAAMGAFAPELAVAIDAPRHARPDETPPAGLIEEELMIVEEDPRPEPPARKSRGIPQARRQEYRQLFSMLRRSEGQM
ncbi:MAG TPA: AAA family ATPase [Pirellulales bacterium]|nr:AAA family ATPase [Pirellulales bacterium]